MNPKPIDATSIDAKPGETSYPAPFAVLVKGRTKRKLADRFGLTKFGVNLTELAPGAVSSVAHYHSVQDEFVYLLEGSLTLVLGDQEHTIRAGECFGFKGGREVAHQLRNDGQAPAVYIEIGDRSSEDRVTYPEDDLQAVQSEEGQWRFTRRDGTGDE